MAYLLLISLMLFKQNGWPWHSTFFLPFPVQKKSFNNLTHKQISTFKYKSISSKKSDQELNIFDRSEMGYDITYNVLSVALD